MKEYIKLEEEKAAIVFNDELTSKKALSRELTIWLFHLEIRGTSTLGTLEGDRDRFILSERDRRWLNQCPLSVVYVLKVAPGPERPPDATAGAPEAAGDAPVVNEGALARLARVEEEVHEIQETLGEQREVMDVMAKDLSKFTVWAAGGISQLLDSAGATYVRYSETHVPYQRRRVRQRTGDASTSTAQ
nr:hypothetical protein [Tanacetum cinerariifolium]